VLLAHTQKICLASKLVQIFSKKIDLDGRRRMALQQIVGASSSTVVKLAESQLASLLCKKSGSQAETSQLASANLMGPVCM
jgi:hypothetical protein